MDRREEILDYLDEILGIFYPKAEEQKLDNKQDEQRSRDNKKVFLLGGIIGLLKEQKDTEIFEFRKFRFDKSDIKILKELKSKFEMLGELEK